MPSSIEERLFTAFEKGEGLTLSWDDVNILLMDDAIETRITNQAAIEAGVEESGGSEIGRHSRLSPETWAQFKARLKRKGRRQ